MVNQNLGSHGSEEEHGVMAARSQAGMQDGGGNKYASRQADMHAAGKQEARLTGRTGTGCSKSC